MPETVRFLRLARQEVIAPDIAGIKRRQEEIERAKRPPQEMPRPRDNCEDAQQRIDECLAAIRSAPDGAKHPTYVAEAARAKAICDKHGIEWAPIRGDLIATYENALTAVEANRRRRSSTLGVVGWLERRAG